MSTDFTKPLSAAELELLNGRNPDRPRESDLGGDYDQAAASMAESIADEVAQSGEEGQSSDKPIESEVQTDGGQELQGVDGQSQQDGKQVGSEASQSSEADGSWITENVKRYAETYGFTPDDLREFGSQDELERVAAKLDKYVGRLFKPVDQQEAPAGQPQATSGQQTQQVSAQNPATPAAAPIPDKPGFKDGKIDLEYFKSNYAEDDPILAVVEHALAQDSNLGQALEAVNRLREESEAVIKHLAQQEQYNQTNALHSAMDSYSPDLYGKAFDEHGNPVTLSAELIKKRSEVYNEINETIWPRIERLQRLGQLQHMPTYPELVHQAARAIHAKELDAIASKKKAEALVAQNKKIRQVSNGASGYRPRVPAKGPMSDYDKLMNNPVLQEHWDSLSKEGIV